MGDLPSTWFLVHPSTYGPPNHRRVVIRAMPSMCRVNFEGVGVATQILFSIMDSILEDQIFRLAFGSREGTAPFAAGEV